MKSEKNKARNWVIPKTTSMTPSLHTHTHTYTHTRREQPKDWHWKLTKSPAGCLNRNGIGVPSVLWPHLTFRGSTSGAKGLWSDWGLPVTSVGCNMDAPDRISARACPHYSGAVMLNPGRGKEEEIEQEIMGRAFLLQLFGRTWAIVSLLDKMCLEWVAAGTMPSLTHPAHTSPDSSEKPHRQPRATACRSMARHVAQCGMLTDLSHILALPLLGDLCLHVEPRWPRMQRKVSELLHHPVHLGPQSFSPADYGWTSEPLRGQWLLRYPLPHVGKAWVEEEI